VDLVRVNPHKPAVMYPNGFTTFRELHEGERLYLPDKWFSKEFDELPQTYFKALPHPDGVTPSSLGTLAAGVLGDYAQLDAATVSVGELASSDNRDFYEGVDSTAAKIDISVEEAKSKPESAGIVEAVHAGTNQARLRNLDLGVALDTGNEPAALAARLEVQSSLSTALGAARIALQVFYGEGSTAPPTPSKSIPPEFTATMKAAAKAVADAIGADANYCVSVSQPGTATYAVVQAFKLAWNTAKKQPPLAVGTGYDQATADAIARVVGASPTACAAPVATSEIKKTSTATIIGWGLAGAVVIGGVVYYLLPRFK
jgi:hypothetical protein